MFFLRIGLLLCVLAPARIMGMGRNDHIRFRVCLQTLDGYNSPLSDCLVNFGGYMTSVSERAFGFSGTKLPKNHRIVLGDIGATNARFAELIDGTLGRVTSFLEVAALSEFPRCAENLFDQPRIMSRLHSRVAGSCRANRSRPSHADKYALACRYTRAKVFVWLRSTDHQ